MAITRERLRQTFSEGGALEIYQEVKAGGDFLGFAKGGQFLRDHGITYHALATIKQIHDDNTMEMD